MIRRGFVVQQVDVSSQFAYIMAPKEESEIKTISKASQVTCDVFNKYLKEQIMEAIDADKVLIIIIMFTSFFLLLIV